ncbi:MAG: class I SAM-dependent methyltransferase [Alphaproteobacteria bacterium]|nr:MAG: class I SAM-dependent methyltransferase [Alphaproteobacteria bacterium]
MPAEPPVDWAAFWDQRYNRPDYAFGQEANTHLRSQAWRLAPDSTVLVPADGEGRNGVFLATAGHRVTSVDISPLGCAKAQRLAEQRGVQVTVVQADLEQWSWPVAAAGTGVGAVVSIFFHLPPDLRRALHRRMAEALAPGGLIILEGYHPDQIPLKQQYGSGGPGDARLLYTPEMLAEDFHDLSIVELTSGRVTLAEGPLHSGPAAVTRGIWRRD